MKERPILFNGRMVRAILGGSKTQTRRVAGGQTIKTHTGFVGLQGPDTDDIRFDAEGGEWYCERGMWHKRCPFGQPGDRLWVREIWAFERNAIGSAREEDGPFAYRATDSEQRRLCNRWRPSIHMPRWASRILLEITSVRVERLQDISEVDAIAEGATHIRSQAWDREHFPAWRYLFEEAIAAGAKPPIGPSPAQAYEKLWESINGAGSWDANPWVWVVEFKRVAP